MKLMILDGNSVINRAFYGVRLLSTRDGVYTNAIYGFLNILEKLRTEENPDALCVAFDLKGPTFRHLRYDGYKATRHPMPEELAMQMPLMKDVLHAMNIPIFACQGWEADDVLGTVGRLCGQSGWQCVIVTGDRDSLQLVDPFVHVKLVSSKMGQTISTLYDEDKFREEYGFAPARLVDLKGLMGDSSDNIPGVAGIGPKTAGSLLLQFGTLSGVYENLQSIRETTRKKLEADRQNAFLSYELATIHTDAPIDFRPEDCLVREADNDALFELLHRLEFTRLIERYHLHAPKSRPQPSSPAAPVLGAAQPVTPQTLENALLALEKAEFVSVAVAEELQSCTFCDGKTVYLFSAQTLADRYDRALKSAFSDKIKKSVHDAKELIRALLRAGIEAQGIVFDTALAAYLLDATKGSYALSEVAEEYLGQQTPGDPAITVFSLTQPLKDRLKELEMEKLFYEIELPLCGVLARMEQDGVLVDQFALIGFGNMLSERIDACRTQIFSMAGEEFNINSPKQLGQILFEKLELPALKKTKSGYATNAEVLEKLRSRHPIIQSILDYRMLTKLKSTYSDGLLKEIAEDGRIHTTLQNLVTATGRLSSTEPNLQNIPVRTELGSEIRKMFVPAEGCVFVDADYSQIELRVLAHIADDRQMQQAFASGADIHTATAAQVFGVSPQEVTPTMRRNAKAVNFGIVYGISDFSLSEDIGVSRKEAKQYIENYLENYAGVREYMKRIVQSAKECGYVTTLFGRRRNLPELKSSNFNIRSFGERVALNTPIQGTAADIIKLAMLRVQEALREKKLRAKLILQVHDELIVECPLSEAELVKSVLKEQMQSVCSLRVPLLAEAKTGQSWYEAK